MAQGIRAPRISTPKVIRGEVRKKNNWSLSPDYYEAPLPRTVLIDRKRPGAGYRHCLTVNDVRRFLEILPDWKPLAVGLNAIVLAPGEPGLDGFHCPGVVHVCAWKADLWRECSPSYYRDHQDIFTRLGVSCERLSDGYYRCEWEESSVRAFQVLHILLHELGHHHDRMTTRSQRRASRGEAYAEEYARRYEAVIWNAYHKEFAR